MYESTPCIIAIERSNLPLDDGGDLSMAVAEISETPPKSVCSSSREQSGRRVYWRHECSASRCRI